MNREYSILVVDDSENDRLLLRAAFERAGLKKPLREVPDGEQAIAYLKGEGAYSDRAGNPLPTVMLLDLNMPLKNGFEVLQWVRQQPGLKRMTIIVLTASTREEDVERAFDLGANAFLLKPTKLETLVAMVRSLHHWMEFNRFPSLNEFAPSGDFTRSAASSAFRQDPPM